MPEMHIRSLDQEYPLEKEMATHSSILAWRIPWTGEPGGLQSMELQRVGHDLATKRHNDSFVLVSCGGGVQSLSCVRLFATPWTVAHQAPLSMGFSRQESWSGLPCCPPENPPDSGIKLASPATAPLAGPFFNASTTGEACICTKYPKWFLDGETAGSSALKDSRLGEPA